MNMFKTTAVITIALSFQAPLFADLQECLDQGNSLEFCEGEEMIAAFEDLLAQKQKVLLDFWAYEGKGGNKFKCEKVRWHAPSYDACKREASTWEVEGVLIENNLLVGFGKRNSKIYLSWSGVEKNDLFKKFLDKKIEEHKAAHPDEFAEETK